MYVLQIYSLVCFTNTQLLFIYCLCSMSFIFMLLDNTLKVIGHQRNIEFRVQKPRIQQQLTTKFVVYILWRLKKDPN